VVFAAGQDTPGHDPHSSWHVDGRVHHKSFNREFERFRKQALDDDFAGVELFVTTPVTRVRARSLPDCAAARFDSVMEVPVEALDEAPHGTRFHVELLGPKAEPAEPDPIFDYRLVQRAVIDDGRPEIAISAYGRPIASKVNS
jgi:hypothetical protein